MNEAIKITFGDTEYELEYDPFRIKEATMEFIVNGIRYVGKAIQKESTIPDYEIVSHRGNDILGTIEIYSVKRLSDGEVFSIGDIDIAWGEIKGFVIDKTWTGGMYAQHTKKDDKTAISVLRRKPNVPLFTKNQILKFIEEKL